MTVGPGAHRLLAILSADGVGYSRLMSADEHGTVAALAAAREIFRGCIEAGEGRVIDMAGDSVLAVFGTAAGAVNAAVATQRRLAVGGSAVSPPAKEPLRFRVGVHLGDVIEQADGSVYGDGVNVAARLQAEADPGGIVVSQSVQEAVAGRIEDLRCTDLGPRRLKNIARPVRMFRVEWEQAAPRGSRFGFAGWRRPAGPKGRFATLPRVALAVALLAVVAALAWLAIRPRDSVSPSSPPLATVGQSIVGKSIAVLAFEGVGGDTDNDSFATGLSDELITTLSRIPGLKVAPRTSAYYFKGKPAPVEEIARRLGVYYLVTGTVRKAGSKVKIAVQLVSAADASSVWSREYDRQLQDIFAVQAEIARLVAANLQVKIGQAEIASGGTTDLEARRFYLQAQQTRAQDPSSNEVIISLLRQSLRRDPGFVQARLLLIGAQLEYARYTYGERNEPALRALIDEARQLADAHPTLFEAQATLARALYAGWQLTDSAAAESRAIRLGEGTAQADVIRMRAAAADGRMSDALAQMKEVVEADPLSSNALTQGAFLMTYAGRPADALVYASRALELVPDARFTLALKALALARLGETKAALETADAIAGGPGATYFGVTALAIIGDTGRLEARLREIEATQPHSFFHAYLLLHLQQPERALDELHLERVTPGDFFLRMQYDPAWDPVRATPRFRSMLATLGVVDAHDRAQAWRAAHPPPPPFMRPGSGR